MMRHGRAPMACAAKRVVQFLDAQHLGAYHPYRSRNQDHHQRGDDVVHRRAQRGHQSQGHDDGRKRHQGVHDPLDHEIQDAAYVGTQGFR